MRQIYYRRLKRKGGKTYATAVLLKQVGNLQVYLLLTLKQLTTQAASASASAFCLADFPWGTMAWEACL